MRRDLVASLCFVMLLGAPIGLLGARPINELALHLAAAFALALAAVTPASRSRQQSIAIPMGAMFLLAGLAWLQSLALPETVVEILSPEHARLASISAERSGTGRVPQYFLSLAPEASRSAALSWATAAALFFAGYRAGPRLLFAAAILIGGLLQIALGLPSWLDYSDIRLDGTLGSPGNLAVYLEMALATAFAGACWASSRRAGTGVSRGLRVGALIAVWLVLFRGLMLTGSRAGVAAAVLGVAFQGLLWVCARRRWRIWKLGVAALFLAAIGVAVVGTVGIRESLLVALDNPLIEASTFQGRPDVYEVVYEGGRLDAWSRALEVWPRFPWLGTGHGSFLAAFELVHPAWMRGVTFHHAHNDALELLVTGGLVSAAVGAIGLLSVLWMLWVNLSRSRSSEVRALALAGLGAVASVGLLELTHFGLLRAPNAATLAILVGAAVSAEPRRKRGSSRSGRAAELDPARATGH